MRSIYRKRPKLFEQALENIKDPDLAQKYVDLQKEVNSKLEEVNNLNSEISELRDQMKEIKDEAKENSEKRQEAQEEAQEEKEEMEEMEESLNEDDEEIIIPIEKKDDSEVIYPLEYNDDEYDKEKPYEETDDETEEDFSDEAEYDEETGQYVFYLDINPKPSDKKRTLIKVFQRRNGENWEISVGSGYDEEGDILEKMTFENDYKKFDIVSYLSNIYDDVEEITESEYNNYIDDKEEIEEIDER